MKPRLKSSIFPFFISLQIASQHAAATACAGADLSKLTSAVYVSPNGTDSDTCGQNAGSACKTIQQGIKNCRGDSCGVLIRYGVYELAAPVELVNGVSLFGSCNFDESGRKYRSMVLGRPAIRANNINTPTTLSGLVILGTRASGPGEASFAMVISNSRGLILSRDVLASGPGGAGGNGVPVNGGVGGNGGFAFGNSGGTGGKACSASSPLGSPGDGGAGADFQQLKTSGCFVECYCSNDNYPASVGKPGQNSDMVPGGGGGQRGGAGCLCSNRAGQNSENGPPGANGHPGACGVLGGVPSGDNKGSFNGTAWIAGRGGGGMPGQVGSGGGGGGSGGYAVFTDISRYKAFPGKPGGGGGGGGCGGPGGQGGQQGGASVPLVLFQSSVGGLDSGSNVLIPGPGGRGGDGAIGGTGGTGGSGSIGAKGHLDDVKSLFCNNYNAPGSGGKGGDGGRGGAGGGGSGGNGGPSFGIALVNSEPIVSTGIPIYHGQRGAGGSLGPGGQNEPAQCKGPDGRAGLPGFSENSIVFFTSAALAENQ